MMIHSMLTSRTEHIKNGRLRYIKKKQPDPTFQEMDISLIQGVICLYMKRSNFVHTSDGVILSVCQGGILSVHKKQ